MVQIGEAIELSEGDLVLTINKTIDLMRQVREMLADVMPSHPLRVTLREAEGLVRRGIVEQSLTMGFAPADVNLPETEAVTGEVDALVSANGLPVDEVVPVLEPSPGPAKKRTPGRQVKTKRRVAGAS